MKKFINSTYIEIKNIYNTMKNATGSDLFEIITSKTDFEKRNLKRLFCSYYNF